MEMYCILDIMNLQRYDFFKTSFPGHVNNILYLFLLSQQFSKIYVYSPWRPVNNIANHKYSNPYLNFGQKPTTNFFV